MAAVDVADLITRVKQLKEWEVVVKVPDEFQFYGTVPYDMSIANGVAFVKVWATTLEEAVGKAKKYFDGPQEES